MPEYSSTTITPADGVQVPSMNGSTSGNFALSALKSYMLSSKGQANGLAGLDGNGKLDPSQIPDSLDDVLVYATRTNFPETGNTGKLYITADTNGMYRWDDTLSTPDYVELSVDLSAYATKAELAAEESAREAEDTNLKNALTAVDHRVQNLEQAKGDYVPVDSDKGVITTPSGKGKWAVVEKLRGVTRVKNQLIPDNNITYTFTVPQNITTEQWGASIMSCASLVPYVGHKVLAFRESHSEYFYVAYGNNATVFTTGGYASGDPLSGVYNLTDTLVGSGGSLYIRYLAGLQAGTYTINIHLVDLNIYFNTSDLSFLGAANAEILATIQRDYPELLIPSDYDAGSLVSTTYSGVKSKSRNLWNGQYESGIYYPSTGAKTDYANYIRCVNLIPVPANTAIYVKSDQNLVIGEWDADGNYIANTFNGKNTTFTTSGNTAYISFYTDNTVTVGQICINVSDSQNGTYTPYFESTLSLPTPITLRSAGSVAEEFDLETGEKTNPVGSYTFANTDAWSDASPLFYLTIGAVNANKDATLGKSYTQVSSYSDVIATDKSFYIGGNDNDVIYVHDSAFTSALVCANDMAGSILNYALATPLAPTQLTPIQNPTILTESGGTISVITEEPIDGNFSVGFITL